MQRPSSINLTAGLMVLFVVFGVYTIFTTPIVMPSTMPQTATPISPSAFAAMAHGTAALFSLIALVFVLFYWLGHEWARWAVMIYSVWTLLWIFAIVKTFQLSHLNGAVTLAKDLVSIYLLWNLNTAPVKAWFKGPKTGELAA
jgi:hypothetical protein